MYTYAVEEFGKLLILENSQHTKNGDIKILYKNQFTNHEYKFTIAFNYFSENNLEDCMTINNEGDYSIHDFNWKDFHIGLLADFNSRLSIFYSDFERYRDNSNEYEIVKMEKIDKKFLPNAIKRLLELVIRKIPFDRP